MQQTEILNEVRAQEIMGKNMVGIREVSNCLKPTFHWPNMHHLGDMKTSSGRVITESELHECKDTHVLIACFPISIIQLRQKEPSLFLDQKWYDNEKFAHDPGTAGWHLIDKHPVRNSMFMTLSEQQKLLGKDDSVPTARVLAYTKLIFLLCREPLTFTSCWMRSCDRESSGQCVSIRGSREVMFECEHDDHYYDHLWLSSERKP